MNISSFKKTITSYYRKNKREFAWRNTRNPYHIFVSEVMLQQTQTERVKKKYPLFLKRFPTIESLAKATLREVLQEWQGMGYNRRGKYLKESAEIMCKKYKGVVPKDIYLVDELPGIGPATAASIVCFSYNAPTIFIETNIRRVFIHFFFQDKTEIDDRDIFPLIEKTLDIKHPREWYYALMDYGAMLGKLKDNPNKKSKHYSVQPSFEGSDRKIRGQILRLLLEKNKLSRNEIMKKLNIEKKRGENLLRVLEQEHLIGRKADSYFIQ